MNYHPFIRGSLARIMASFYFDRTTNIHTWLLFSSVYEIGPRIDQDMDHISVLSGRQASRLQGRHEASSGWRGEFSWKEESCQTYRGRFGTATSQTTSSCFGTVLMPDNREVLPPVQRNARIEKGPRGLPRSRTAVTAAAATVARTVPQSALQATTPQRRDPALFAASRTQCPSVTVSGRPSGSAASGFMPRISAHRPVLVLILAVKREQHSNPQARLAVIVVRVIVARPRAHEGRQSVGSTRKKRSIDSIPSGGSGRDTSAGPHGLIANCGTFSRWKAKQSTVVYHGRSANSRRRPKIQKTRNRNFAPLT